jgi:hypothetical protein
VPSIPGESPVTLEFIEPFGSAGMAENADAGEVKPSGVDAHERGGALPVMVVGAAPALVEGTTGVEPTGEAERAAAVKSEAWAPRTQGEARWGVETQPREGNEPPPEVLPQKGERKPQALPPKAGRMLEAPPQKGRHKPEGLPPEGEHELDAMP